MNSVELAKKIEGLQTASTISKILNVNKKTAINYISLLRKNGYVKETIYGSRKIRMYKISTLKKENLDYGNPGFYEVLDKNSKVKIYSPYEKDKVYDKKLSIEEAIVRAIKTGEFRVILASLGLFAKVKNWVELSNYADKENIGRKVGALYDVARIIIKVKRMDKRIRNKLLKSQIKNKFIISKIKSKDLKNIEKIWNVYVPFNKSDLEVYKE